MNEQPLTEFVGIPLTFAELSNAIYNTSAYRNWIASAKPSYQYKVVITDAGSLTDAELVEKVQQELSAQGWKPWVR